MKTKVWVNTPYGDFDYVPTDFANGCSCDQCAARGLGRCCELPCSLYDNEKKHYHLERRTK